MRLVIQCCIFATATASSAVTGLRLGVDPTNGDTWIEGIDAFDSFAIESDVGALLPQNLPWIAGMSSTGIFVLNGDPLDPDPFDGETVLFSILTSPDDSSAIATTYKSTPIPGPGFVSKGGGIYLGSIVDVDRFADENALSDDIELLYMNFDVSNDVFSGQAVFIPEPSTLDLEGSQELPCTADVASRLWPGAARRCGRRSRRSC